MSFSLEKSTYFLKKQKMLSLFLRNLLMVCFILVLPLFVVIAITNLSFREFTDREILVYSSKSIASIKNQTDNIINNSLAKMNYFASNISVQLFSITKPDDIIYYDKELICTLLKSQVMIQDCLDDIYIYSPVNNQLISQDGRCDLSAFYDLSWLDSYKAHAGSPRFWYELRNGVNSSNTGTLFLTLYKTIDPASTSKGVIVCNIDYKKFIQKYLYSIRSEYDFGLCIVDENNKLISDLWGNHQDYLSDKTLTQLASSKKYTDTGKYILFRSPIEGTTWSYISAVSVDIYEASSSHLRNTLYLVMVIGFLVSLVIALLVSLRIYRPIGAILRLLNQPVTFFDTDHPFAQDEESFILSTVAKTLENNSSMKQELEQRYLMLKKAQAIALQAQINPHFLYNTLDDINWAAMKLAGEKIGRGSPSNEVSAMVVMLSSLLRYSLEHVDSTVPLSTELEYAKNFMDLQKIRYGNLIHMEWSIDPATLSCSVIKILFQPILENAVEHGVLPSGRTDCLIKIESRLDREYLLLIISDNGYGMSQAQVNELNESMRNTQSIQEKEHIGIRNVNQRICLFYGENYGIEISSLEPCGTRVTIKLPGDT